jgi:hypothetical protein
MRPIHGFILLIPTMPPAHILNLESCQRGRSRVRVSLREPRPTGDGQQIPTPAPRSPTDPRGLCREENWAT